MSGVCGCFSLLTQGFKAPTIGANLGNLSAETPTQIKGKNAMAEQAEKGRKAPKARQSVRFDGDTLDQLTKLAAVKNMSFANLVRVACEVYLAKQELADELDGMEERLASSILRTQKESGKVADDVQLLIALFDQLAQFIFITTPEVIDKEAAGAVGKRRHAAFIAELHNAFSTRRRKAGVTEKLESMEEPNGKRTS